MKLINYIFKITNVSVNVILIMNMLIGQIIKHVFGSAVGYK